MNIHLEIHTHDRGLHAALMDTGAVTQDGTTKIPGDATLTDRARAFPCSAGMPEVMEVRLAFESGVASEAVASYLYEKLNGTAIQLKMDSAEVEIEPDQIARIIRHKRDPQQ